MKLAMTNDPVKIRLLVCQAEVELKEELGHCHGC